MISKWLTHPLLRNTDFTEAETIEVRRRLIEDKPLLCQIYQEWYRLIAEKLQKLDGPVVELGSGPGFFEKFCPNVIKSDIYHLITCHAVIDGMALPFSTESVAAFTMTNVTHHIRDARVFLKEASRCLKPGGRIVMIEPWNTRWSKFIYTHFHTEPFDDSAQTWEFSSDNPLYQSNQAVPWIIFERDYAQFEREFPEYKLMDVVPMNPISYLLSGGISMRRLTPQWSEKICRKVDTWLLKHGDSSGMFALISVQKMS